jgi:hypothetical protein
MSWRRSKCNARAVREIRRSRERLCRDVDARIARLAAERLTAGVSR